MKSVITLALFTIICFVTSSYGQNNSDAEALFKIGNYQEALSKYLNCYNEKTADANLNYKIGYCYLHTNTNKNEATKYLELAIKAANFDKKALYWLAHSYHLQNKFDEAISTYNKYTTATKGDNKEDVIRQIEMCEEGKKLIQKPINVTFRNLGKEVNSEYAEYYPFIPADESFLIYTTRRKTVTAVKQYDGYYSSDVFLATVKNGEFAASHPASNAINTPEDEECVGLTPNGKLCLVYVDHAKNPGDICITEINQKNFSRSKFFNETINSTSLESSASINTDGNMLVFSSNRTGGFGGTDIYYSKLLPDGTWAEALNIGTTLNTKYDEEFPQLTQDGKTLYFSSKGHNSMGGFDIFKTTFDSVLQKWKEPKNIGYPINTSDDELQFAISANQHDAYISAFKEGGFGDLDIWHVAFNDVDPRLTFIKGRMFVGDSLHPVTENLRINVIDKSTGLPMNQYFKYWAKKQKFYLALPPGNYLIEVESTDHKKANKEIQILDKSDFKVEDDTSIILKDK